MHVFLNQSYPSLVSVWETTAKVKPPEPLPSSATRESSNSRIELAELYADRGQVLSDLDSSLN
jgi:hypothetical protein